MKSRQEILGGFAVGLTSSRHSAARFTSHTENQFCSDLDAHCITDPTFHTYPHTISAFN
jgi:hypothetical protein